MTCNGMCMTPADVGLPGYVGITYPHPDCPEHGDRREPSDERPELRCAGCKRTPAEIPGYAELAEPGQSADDYVSKEEGTLDSLSGAFLCDPCYIKAGQPSFPFPKRWTASPANLRALGL